MSDKPEKSGISSSGRLSLKPGGPAALRDPGKEAKRKWLLLGVGTAAVIIVITSLTAKKPEQALRQAPREAVVDLTPKDVDKRGWQSQSQADIQNLNRRLEQLEAENRRLATNATSKGGAATPPAGVVPPPQALPELNFKTAGPVPPPLPAPVPVEQAPAAPGASPGASVGHGPPLVKPATQLAPVAAPPAEDKPRRMFAAPKTEEEVQAAVKPKAMVSYRQSKYASYMTPGFAKAVLLHGVDASTSVTAQANPQPVMLRVQDFSILPGAARYDIKGCFVTAAASGNISSERVEMRLAAISCTDKNDGLVLEQPVKGYVVDSDGSIGMRGKLIDRQGAKLQKTMLAGFAQGLTQSAATAATTTATSTTGIVSTVSGSDAFRQAGFQGLSGSANMLASFYMKQAEAMAPILEVPANRLATIVFSEGVSLQWQDSESFFSKEYKVKEGK